MAEKLKNHRGAITCIMLMIDRFAWETDSTATVETRHQMDCGIFRLKSDLSGEAEVQNGSIVESTAATLAPCTCDVSIDAVFAKSNREGSSLMIPFTLSVMTKKHPWLGDEDATRDVVRAVESSDRGLRLFQDLKTSFGPGKDVITFKWDGEGLVTLN